MVVGWYASDPLSQFRISEKTAKRDMKKLVDFGLVVKRGVKKGAYFEAR